MYRVQANDDEVERGRVLHERRKQEVARKQEQYVQARRNMLEQYCCESEGT
jgi:hypothetical protein